LFPATDPGTVGRLETAKLLDNLDELYSIHQGRRQVPAETENEVVPLKPS